MKLIDDNAKFLDFQGEDVIEITHDWFFGILEAVPPLDFGENWFVCGEPDSIDDNGRMRYNHFLKHDGKYYAFRALLPSGLDTLLSILNDQKL